MIAEKVLLIFGWVTLLPIAYAGEIICGFKHMTIVIFALYLWINILYFILEIVENPVVR